MEKAVFITGADGRTESWYILETTTIAGQSYLLVSDSAEDEEATEARILKEVSVEDGDVMYEDVTDEKSVNFVPQKDRIATFDMDGTILGELYPTYFEYNMLEYRVLDDPSYKDKASESERAAANAIRAFVRNGKKLPADFALVHANAAAKAYSGMSVEEFDAYVKKYAQKTPNGFAGMTFAQSFYKPMLEVFAYLKSKGFTSYVVSGSDRFIARALVSFIDAVEPEYVIGMDDLLKTSGQGDDEGVDYTCAVGEKVVRTDKLIIKNIKNNKVKQIAQEIGKIPVLSFGNSDGDCAMHNYCLSNQKYKSRAFMLIADDDQDDHANREKALGLGEKWKESGYVVISMRDDFKTIYGSNVKKVDFVF